MLMLAQNSRLGCAGILFPRVKTGADIGANHGKLGLSLLQGGKADLMYLTDQSASALEAARKNAYQAHLEDRVRFIVTDGFKGLPDTIEAAAILGMGGKTIAHIIESAFKSDSVCIPETLILSPNTEHRTVRHALYTNGFSITQEQIAFDSGRYYEIIAARFTGERVTPDEHLLSIGPCLMRDVSPLYRAYVEHKVRVYAQSHSAEGQKWLRWYSEELQRVKMHGKNSL